MINETEYNEDYFDRPHPLASAFWLNRVHWARTSSLKNEIEFKVILYAWLILIATGIRQENQTRESDFEQRLPTGVSHLQSWYCRIASQSNCQPDELALQRPTSFLGDLII